MKLRFHKDEESNIVVTQEIGGETEEFSYINMIKALLKDKNMNKAEISSGFSEAEIRSINSMVQHINDALKEKKK